MSVEDLKKFGHLCQGDETVRARAKQIGIYDPDGLIAYAAKELDLEFTQDDMVELAREVGVSKDELSEEDLEKIAGGVVTTTVVVMGALVGTALAGGIALAGGMVAGMVVGAGVVAGVTAATVSKAW